MNQTKKKEKKELFVNSYLGSQHNITNHFFKI
jgi:hypothetical protein